MQYDKKTISSIVKKKVIKPSSNIRVNIKLKMFILLLMGNWIRIIIITKIIVKNSVVVIIIISIINVLIVGSVKKNQLDIWILIIMSPSHRH
jgi:hypothetical protein